MKKAQITLFVIIGIVLVISAALFLFMKRDIQGGEVNAAGRAIVEELPSQFSILRPFVENCLRDTAKAGIILLGERGGYIYNEKLSPGAEATEGDSVRFTRGSDLVIPYWFYMASQNDCTGECDFKSRKLALRKGNSDDSAEEQLSRYIEGNIGGCIDGFRSMNELGYNINEKRKPRVKVIFAERDIAVSMEYPIEIIKQDSKAELEDFYTTLDVDMNKIYEMADYLTKLEKEYRILETHTLNLIDGFSGRDSSKLPPRVDSSFEMTSSVVWVKSKVKKDLQAVLMAYVPILRMTDTLGWKEVDTGDRYVDSIYNRGMSLPNNSSVNDVYVSLTYLDFWEMYFDLNCNGERCEPESFLSDILPIGAQRYNFVYDVSYPVLVEIRDPEALEGRGYSFNFMLESNVRSNEPMYGTYEPIEFIASGNTMLCDENKRNSGTVRIEAVDSMSGERIDDVGVYFSCIEDCYIGETENGILESSMPVCLGGRIILRKEGYETETQDLDSYVEDESVLRIEMKPRKEMNIAVKKKVLRKHGSEWEFAGEEDLADYEKAIISFVREENNAFDMTEIREGEEQSVTLSEGTYEISINLVAEEDYVIPQYTMYVEGEAFDVDQFNAPILVTGMTRLKHEFTEQDMRKDKVVVYVLSADLYGITPSERRMEDLDIVSQLDELQSKYLYELKPRLE